MLKKMTVLAMFMLSFCALSQQSQDDWDCRYFPPGHEVYEFFSGFLGDGNMISNGVMFSEGGWAMGSCGCLMEGGREFCVGDQHPDLGIIVAVGLKSEGWVVSRRASLRGAREMSFYALDGLTELLEYYRENGRTTVY